MLSFVAAAAAKSTSDPAQVVFHKDLATSIIIFFVVCAAWGIFLWARGQAPSGSYLGALAIGVGLIALQGLAGIVLVVTGYAPHGNQPFMHWVYGFVLLFTIPFVYGAWTQRRNDRVSSLLYALGCVLIVLIAFFRMKYTAVG